MIQGHGGQIFVKHGLGDALLQEKRNQIGRTLNQIFLFFVFYFCPQKMQILRKRGHNKGLTGKHKLSRSGDGYTGSLLDTVDVRETIKLKLTSKGDLETHYVPYP